MNLEDLKLFIDPTNGMILLIKTTEDGDLLAARDVTQEVLDKAAKHVDITGQLRRHKKASLSASFVSVDGTPYQLACLLPD